MPPTPNNPREWLDVLVRRLDHRWQTELAPFDAYYEGDQNLAFVTRKFNQAYGNLFTALTDNWMPIVVNAPVERLTVQGFRFGESEDADKDAWRIWQANNLDGDSNLVHTEAGKLGMAYWMVAPTGTNTPRITAEHPSQVIVATDPGDRRKRTAALKKWRQDDFVYANVYLPDRVVKYRTTDRKLRTTKDGDPERWETIAADGNPLGEVPIIPILNNPSMLRGGRSDLAGGICRLQDALNVLLADLLIGAEYQAYPLRILLGVESPVDSAGQPIKNADLAVSQARLLMFPNPEAKVAEFSEAKLTAFIESMREIVNHLTAQTRTPPHYVSGQIVNASGDALKAAETGLVSKVKAKMLPFGEGHEEALRLAFRAIDANDPRATATDAETIWRDPESRSQAETVDAAVKLSTIGVPKQALWERIGASPQEIDRWSAMADAEALLADTLQPQVPPGEQLPAMMRTNGASGGTIPTPN